MVTSAGVDIAFACERIRDLWDEVLPLMVAHHRERAETTPDLPPLEIDQVQYEVLDAMGRLRVYTARADGALAGYASFVLAQPLHHKGTATAVHDALFLLPAHRLGLTGLQLVSHADRELAAEGIARVLQVAPVGSGLGPALSRLGYHPLEITYTKRLTGRAQEG